jgi:flagellar hook assembly protein FlgD
LIRVASPPREGDVAVEVVDAQGRVIWRTLRAANPDAGAFDVTWDGRDLDGHAVPCGSYFCRITAGTETRTERITVLR